MPVSTTIHPTARRLSRRSLTRGLAAIGAASAAGVGPVLAPAVLAEGKKPSYGIQDLGVLPQGNYSIGNAINAGHQVAGMAKTNGDSRAVVRRDDELIDISGQPISSSALDINDAGHVVGFLTSSTGLRATLWRDGAAVDLGTFGGGTSIAHGLNNAGAVIGEAATDTGEIHAFRWVEGTLSDLGTLGGEVSSAQDVNDAGVVVGHSTKNPGESMYGDGTVGVVWQVDGTVVEIPALGGAVSVAVAVNIAGVVVGASTTEAAVEYGGVGTHAFKWENGSLFDLGTFNGTNVSVANDINAGGWIAGFGSNPDASTPDDAMAACVWDADGAMWNLNECVKSKKDWTLSAAIGIDDDGWITGYGVKDGQFRGFILKPR